MNGKKLAAVIVLAAIVLAVAIIAIKLISGVFHLLNGALNAVLGIGVILALVVIVVWMFAYAKKNK